MGQEEKELQTNIDDYVREMDERMNISEKNKQALVERIINAKRGEIIHRMFDLRTSILSNFITLYLSQYPYDTLDEQTKKEIDFLKDTQWIQINENNQLVLSDGTQYEIDSLTPSIQSILSSYQKAIEKNHKLKEYNNELVKVCKEDYKKEINARIESIENTFRKMNRNTDPQLLDDIIYNIDTFQEVTNDNGEKSYVGQIDGKERIFSEKDNPDLALAIDSALVQYQLFSKQAPTIDPVILLQPKELKEQQVVEDNGHKTIKAHAKDVDDLKVDLTKQEEIDKIAAEELTKEQILEIKKAFTSQSLNQQNKYINRSRKYATLYDKINDKLPEYSIRRILWNKDFVKKIFKFKSSTLDKIGLGKRVVEGANLSMITGKSSDENKPLFVSRKVANKIEKGYAKLAVTKDGVDALEKNLDENQKETLKEQGVEIKEANELLTPEKDQIEQPILGIEMKDDKINENQVVEAEVVKEEVVDDRKEQSEDSVIILPERKEDVKEVEANLPFNYDALKAYALKEIGKKGLTGKSLEEELSKVGLTKEEFTKYCEKIQTEKKQDNEAITVKTDMLLEQNKKDAAALEKEIDLMEINPEDMMDDTYSDKKEQLQSLRDEIANHPAVKLENLEKERQQLEQDVTLSEYNPEDNWTPEIEAKKERLKEIREEIGNNPITVAHQQEQEYQELKQKVELAEMNPEDMMYPEFNADKSRLSELESSVNLVEQNSYDYKMNQYLNLKNKIDAVDLNPEDMMYPEYIADKNLLSEMETELNIGRSK